MTLQASGQITSDDISVELNRASAAEADWDDLTATANGSSTITDLPDETDDWYSYTHNDAPTNVTSNWNGVAEEMTIGWDDNQATEDRFRIEYQLDSGSGFGAWTLLTLTVANATSHVESYTCSSANTYHYRIRWEEISPSHESNWSNTTSDRTTICPV